MTIIATNISDTANETIKKFCTVRNGRNVNIDRITRIFPHTHRTTIVERINTIGTLSCRGNGEIVVSKADVVVVVVIGDLFGIKFRKFVTDDEYFDMFKCSTNIQSQSIELILNKLNS